MTAPILDESRFLLRNALAPPIRPIGRFAEEEIVVPSGQFVGQRYRIRRQPAIRHWFAAIDSRRWRRYVATGPTQSGKSLNCFVIPIVYKLFECREDVIVGLPDLRLSSRKWNGDLLPVIQKTRYRDLLPASGGGSRGGEVTDVRFRNGATLYFMSRGGSDKARASITAPNLIVTETDGLDTASETSREADPLKQLEARTLSFDEAAFIVMECTVSTSAGRTWSEIHAGTCTRIARPCPHCGEYVTPERDHFRGWEHAENEIEAGEAAAFHCPECAAPWTDDQRFAALDQSRIVHRGQTIDRSGLVLGAEPQTRTFGFRWSAVDNPFRTSRMLGALEWKAARDGNAENADKELRQFQWALPWDPEQWDETPLDVYALAERIGDTPRTVVPAGHDFLTVGVDVGAHKVHYVVTAWQENGTGRVIDYAELTVYSRKLGIERAIVTALTWLRDKVLDTGFLMQHGGELIPPEQVWIDAGYKPHAVYAFIRQCNAMEKWNGVFLPSIGRGAGKQYSGRYSHPHGKTKEKPYIGADFYLTRQEKAGTLVAMINADAGKSWIHQRLATPLVDENGEPSDEPGALSLFVPANGDHARFCRHLTAEKETREFVPDVGEVTVWVVQSRANHYLDGLNYSAFAARYCGVEVLPKPPRPEPREEPRTDPQPAGLFMPDGRPWTL